MLALGEFLVQAPEDLYDRKCGGGNGVGKVTAGGRDGTDDGHGAFPVWGAEAFDAACALVELGELGA